MHTIYHSDAFVLKKQSSGEANVRVWLFTKEFGVIVAMVQGIRKTGAKLSMQLSEYALVSVDLVRGKDVWRLVSVREIDAPFLHTNIERPIARAFVRVLLMVERFCHGEEAHPELFSHLTECLNLLSEKNIAAENFDAFALWKVMVLLGYGTVSSQDETLISSPLKEASATLDHDARLRLVKTTNEVIAHTHL